MKIPLQYISDSKGRTKAVQVNIDDWEKLLLKLKKYEQTLKVKSDLKSAFEEIATVRKSGKRLKTLSEFMNEL